MTLDEIKEAMRLYLARLDVLLAEARDLQDQLDALIREYAKRVAS